MTYGVARLLRDRLLALIGDWEADPTATPRKAKQCQIAIPLTDEQKAKIERVAKAYGVSVSGLVRTEIRKIIKENPASPCPVESRPQDAAGKKCQKLQR